VAPVHLKTDARFYDSTLGEELNNAREVSMETILVVFAAILGVGLIVYLFRLWGETKGHSDEHQVSA
jgi:hypothetical protein